MHSIRGINEFQVVSEVNYQSYLKPDVMQHKDNPKEASQINWLNQRKGFVSILDWLKQSQLKRDSEEKTSYEIDLNGNSFS